PAKLDGPVLPKCHTRFRYPWQWTGGAATLMSRATDETGYVQPTLDVLMAARGPSTAYHFNHIRSWRVSPDGTVKFAGGGAGNAHSQLSHWRSPPRSPQSSSPSRRRRHHRLRNVPRRRLRCARRICRLGLASDAPRPRMRFVLSIST